MGNFFDSMSSGLTIGSATSVGAWDDLGWSSNSVETCFESEVPGLTVVTSFESGLTMLTTRLLASLLTSSSFAAYSSESEVSGGTKFLSLRSECSFMTTNF